MTKLQQISRNEETANRQASNIEHEELNDPVSKVSKIFCKGKDAGSNMKSSKRRDDFHKGHLKNSKAERKTF